MNFFESYYTQYRTGLVNYALRFHRSIDVSEDLFEDSHLALCGIYAELDSELYLKFMKTFIKNRYRNLRWGVRTNVDEWEDLSLVALPDMVIQKEETKRIVSSVQKMSKKDQDLLLGKTSDGRRLYEAKHKLKSHLDRTEKPVMQNNPEKTRLRLLVYRGTSKI